MDSTIASGVSRGLGDAHLRSPTGLIEQFRISPQGGMVGGNSYLRIRNVLELSYIKVGVIQPADKGASPGLDYRLLEEFFE